MRRTLIPIAFAIFSISAKSDMMPVFRPLFDSIISNHREMRLFAGDIHEWGFYDDVVAKGQMQTAFAALSNHVEEAVAMLPTVLTNDLQREVFLHMTGYAGTNAFFQVWDGLLDIAETNAVLCPPILIDDYWGQGTTPLDQYVIFFYELPVCQSLLMRTRNLIPEGTERRSYLDTVLSGAAATESRAYLIDSGEGLPPFLQGNE